MTSKEAKYDEWKRYFFEVDKEMYGYFTQDLERLEVLEKENEELNEKAQKYDELCLHNVMESQSFGDNLIQGILALNERVIERNEKLANAIGILKSYLWVSSEIDFDTYSTSRLTQQEYE